MRSTKTQKAFLGQTNFYFFLFCIRIIFVLYCVHFAFFVSCIILAKFIYFYTYIDNDILGATNTVNVVTLE